MSATPVTPATQRRVSVGNIELAITEYGTSGPPLILLHGIGSRGVSFWPIIDDLAQHFRLIVPDQRGHGDSDKPPTGFLLPDYAGDLARLIDAFELHRPLILGHSLGGIVALAWAVMHPDRAIRIALEDVPLRTASRTAPLFDDWLALASLPVEGAAAYYKREHPDWTDEECHRRAISITSTTPAVFRELRDDALQGDAIDRIAPLAAIRSPILLVRGDLETGSMVVPDDANRLVATAKNARVAHIPAGTHSLHRDQSAAFLDHVIPFLKGDDAQS